MKNSKQSTKKSLLDFWELKNVKDAAFSDGLKKGEIKAGQTIAKKLLGLGLAVELITETTGLTAVEIEKLQSEELDNEENITTAVFVR